MLNERQKNLILDLYFGCGSDEDVNDARALIASSSEASTLYGQLESQMDVLGNVRNETVKCPDHLAKSTVARLKEVAASSRNNIRLTELLEKEREKKAEKVSGSGFWRRAIDTAAVAAGLLIVASIYFPTVNNMRYKSWLTGCKSNMASIANGVSNYALDNDGQLPAVSMGQNAPWWKVGYQGEENHSNTRHLWKLVQGGYVQPGDFVCPGRSGGRAVSLDNQNIGLFRDFPNRKFVTYSSRLIDPSTRKIGKRIIFISDANPMFEDIVIQSYSPDSVEFKAIELCDKLKKKNSVNHNSRGQNVMFTDGSVEFSVTRIIIQGGKDDIYTVKGMKSYSGRERPENDSDVFLVP